MIRIGNHTHTLLVTSCEEGRRIRCERNNKRDNQKTGNESKFINIEGFIGFSNVRIPMKLEDEEH